MRITPFLLSGVLIAAGFAGEASAAPKRKPRPITKTYQATAPVPDPTNWLSDAGVESYSVCAQTMPNSYQIFEFTAPALGKLNLKLTGFVGDWDLLIMDKNNNEVTFGGSAGVNTPDAPTAGDENVTTKVKKSKTLYKIVACNWAGGSTGTVKLTFTYT